KDVQQLGDFVERGSTEKRPDARPAVAAFDPSRGGIATDAELLLLSLSLRGGGHRPELQEAEFLPVAPDTPLLVEDRPAARKPNTTAGRKEDRRRQAQKNRREHAVHGVLDLQAEPPRIRGVLEEGDRQPAKMLDFESGGRLLRELRDESNRDAHVLAA